MRIVKNRYNFPMLNLANTYHAVYSDASEQMQK